MSALERACWAAGHLLLALAVLALAAREPPPCPPCTPCAPTLPPDLLTSEERHAPAPIPPPDSGELDDLTDWLERRARQ